VGKKALRTIIDSYKKKLKVGLMSYNISGVGGDTFITLNISFLILEDHIAQTHRLSV